MHGSTTYGEDRDPGLERLAHLLETELDALRMMLPEAATRQWDRSTVPTPRDDTTERGSGGLSDPTADVAMDTRRLAVRETVERSRVALRDAAIATRGARLALERAVARFDGEGLT